MADATTPLTTDLEERLGRIWRAREESGKFVVEQRKLTAAAMKLERDRMPASWQIALSGMAAGAALFGAGAAFIKILDP